MNWELLTLEVPCITIEYYIISRLGLDPQIRFFKVWWRYLISFVFCYIDNLAVITTVVTIFVIIVLITFLFLTTH